MNYRWVAGIAAILIVPTLAAGAFFIGLQFAGNFHEVIPGQLYRSAQPTPEQLESYVKTYGIKTVLNLRGQDQKNDWYAKEVAETSRLGVKLVDFKMSASHQLTEARAQQLISLLKELPTPVLVHCKSGSDRTGLTSAIYLYTVAGLGEEKAESQISIRYGHVGIPFLSRTYAMDQSWEVLEKLFGLDS